MRSWASPFAILASILGATWASHAGTGLPERDIYLIGEQHGVRAHHQYQADLISQIEPGAIVFEMLSPEQAEGAATVDHSDRETLEASLEWAESGWPSFELYHPIFVEGQGAAIYGAALPRDVARAAISTGAAEQFTGDPVLYGLDDPLAKEEQVAREAAQGASHCDALPRSLLPGFVEAQRLRDASFTQTTIQALHETGGPVVVITGNGHVREDWGMPVYLRRAAPDVSILSIGQAVDPDDATNKHGQFGLVVVSAETPAEIEARGDPCEAFKTN